MNAESEIAPGLDPKEEQRRALLRKAGPMLLIAGVLFVLVATVNFIHYMGDFGRQPKLFWCFFLGLPLLWLGFVLTRSAFAKTR